MSAQHGTHIIRSIPRFSHQLQGRRTLHFFFRDDDRAIHEAALIRREARERAMQQNIRRA